jgi:hypothetical protein
MSRSYEPGDAIQRVAQTLISAHHPELVEARVTYLFTDKPFKVKGREVAGKVTKTSPLHEYLLEVDFIIEVSTELWQDMPDQKRMALIDHLLERCYNSNADGEGDEEPKWRVREPDVQEFGTILSRHGVWHDGLRDFVQVAHQIDIEGIVAEAEEVLGEEVDDLLEETLEETETE